MKKKKLAIIGTGRMAWIYGRHAREMGVESHSFGMEENPLCKESVDYHHVINILDYDTLISKCLEIGIDGAVATTELTIKVAAYVSEKLNLNGMKYDKALDIADKYANRCKCQNLIHLKQPFFKKITNLSDLEDETLNYPLILKPTSCGGKRGIIVVNDEKELEDAYAFTKKDGNNSPTILEQFLPAGMECSVESLSYMGKHYIIQVTEKITSGPPHCVELGHHQPAGITAEMRKKVEMAVIEGLTAIGMNNSPCHTEIKIVDDEVYLIEFNARPGGDNISWPLTMLSTGYSFIIGCIRIALGEFVPEETFNLSKHYAGVYFVTTQTAHLKEVFDTCDDKPWLYKKTKVTDDLVPLEHNDCYNINSMIYYSETERIEFN